MHNTCNNVTIKLSAVPKIGKNSYKSLIRISVRKTLTSVVGSIVAKILEYSARWCCGPSNTGKRGIGKQVVIYRGGGGP